MKTFFFFQDTFKKITGLLLIIPGALLLLISVFCLFTEIKAENSENTVIAVCMITLSLAITIPGILIFRKGRMLSAREVKIRQLTGFLTTYRRMPVAEIGKKLGITEADAESLIALAIEREIIHGHIDRTTGEFYVAGSLKEIKTLKNCPFCGAPVSQVFYTGETAKCQSCGSLFQ